MFLCLRLALTGIDFWSLVFLNIAVIKKLNHSVTDSVKIKLDIMGSNFVILRR